MERIEIPNPFDYATMLAILGDDFLNLIELGGGPDKGVVIMQLMLHNAPQRLEHYRTRYIDDGPGVEVSNNRVRSVIKS